LQTFYDLESVSHLHQELVLTVGVFDGLHIGHRYVIQQVLTEAGKLKLPSAVLAFHPSPLAFLAPEKCPPTLTTLQKKREILQLMGVKIAIFVRFDATLAEMSPDDFVQNVLLQKLKARVVVVGYDWQFGKGRAGNAKVLKSLGEQYQFDVKIVPATEINGLTVHSTRIREAITEGNLGLATQLLGRRYSIVGKIVKGEGRGRQLGYPTANINALEQMLPPNGVYAIRAKLKGDVIDGVLNMGTRPTFDGVKFQVESHLFDFNEMVYGKEIEIIFIEKIRDERSFPNLEALVNQIGKDVESAKAILNQAVE
jgi:riboflavin kinase/FMN adenylyltransferase